MRKEIDFIVTSRDGRLVRVRVEGDKRDLDILEQTDPLWRVEQMVLAPTKEEMRQWYKDKLESGEFYGYGHECTPEEAEELANRAVEEGVSVLFPGDVD